MSLLAAQTLTICKDAAGVAGNIFAFGLFISPIPTFRRIMRNQCTEDFSGLPYLYALLNCLICAWYGTPFMSDDNVLVTTVNTVGAMFQLTYVILYIVYAEKSKKLNTFVLLMGIFGVFAIILSASLFLLDRPTRHVLVGFLTCASLISMFASPLFIIRLVIRTKSVEFMPFYLSLSTFAMSVCFMLYGIFNFDPFVYVNTEKVAVSGKKRNQKLYRRHSGRPGGMKVETFDQLQQRIPERIVEHAVRGMLPKGRLGRALFNHLKVYKGPEHPHEAQKPVDLPIRDKRIQLQK